MMGADIQSIDQRTAKAMLQWWLESGVDVPVTEEPRQWLHPRAAAEMATPTTVEPILPAATMPDRLEAFRSWLETATDLPLDHPGSRRVLPQGAEGAEVMILTDVPAAEDGDRPLGGDAWALAVRMLAAMGLGLEQAYVASISCFSTRGARPGKDELERCAEIARHHVALAKPKRLLLLGDGPARALLGEPVARARSKAHKVGGVRTVATIHPRQLLTRSQDKALAWRDLLLLMDEER